MRELSPRILVAIRRYARNKDDADDLLQDCWLQILKQLDKFTGAVPFARWAAKVSKNVCKMKLRKEKREGMEELAPEDTPEVAEGGPDPGEELLLRRESEVVFAALGKLPDRERDAIVLRLLEGRSAAETAKVLVVSRAGALSVLKRGLAKLRRMEEVRELFLGWPGPR